MPQIFGDLQEPMKRNKDQREVLVGKRWNEVEVEGRFVGNSELGRQIFDQITRKFSDHNDFVFFSGQKGQQTANSSTSQDYVPVNNEGEVSPEQLGEIQRVENELTQSDNVPFDTVMPVAGGLAFIVGLAGSVR
jgi:hypothetical protein